MLDQTLYPSEESHVASKVWFASDQHHGHQSAIHHNHRPFRDLDHMDHALVDEWNSRVGKQDLAFILGDFSFYKPEKTTEIVHAMNGHKILVKGNHDHTKALSKVQGFQRILSYHEHKLDVGGGETVRIVMSHFPFLSWNQMHRGAYHLHGHSHGNLMVPPQLQNARMLDVGVDHLSGLKGHYGPINFAEIMELLKFRRSASTDHHSVAVG